MSVSSCPKCRRPAKRQKRGGFWACHHCDIAWFQEFDGDAPVAAHGAVLEVSASPMGNCCSGRCTKVYTLLQWEAYELVGDFCKGCSRFTSSLGGMNAFLRGIRGATGTASRGDREADAYMEIEERDRVFAFVFQVPLELSKHISSHPPVINSIMILCLAAFGLSFISGGAFAEAFAFPVGPLNLETIPKSLSSIFIHWSVPHLVGNMYFLYAFGRLVEDRLGPFGMVALFLGTGLFADMSYAASRFEPGTLSAGASGAIAGVLGCYFVLFPLRRVGYSIVFTVLRIPAVVYFGGWFLLQIYLADAASTVAYGAHAAGFVGGLLFGLAIRLNPLGLGNWLSDPVPAWLRREV